MDFRKYQHIERFGTTSVENIHLGECYVFPKLDGTNASVWLDEDGCVQAGSRNRKLSLDNDNAGFLEWVRQQDNIKEYLKENPTHRLFGEWLVPHSLKTYKESAWRNFYVFDVAEDNNSGHTKDKHTYIHYHLYKPLLEKYNIEYIPPLFVVENATYEKLVSLLDKNTYLIQDGKGSGEGVVIKNYGYKNKYGYTVWAKIVTSEFKEKHAKTMGATTIVGKKLIEEEIARKYVTKALCEKTKAKIENDLGEFSGKHIPRLLNTVYFDVVGEEAWNFVKEHKNPTINFKTLQHFVFNNVKSNMPQLF